MFVVSECFLEFVHHKVTLLVLDMKVRCLSWSHAGSLTLLRGLARA